MNNEIDYTKFGVSKKASEILNNVPAVLVSLDGYTVRIPVYTSENAPDYLVGTPMADGYFELFDLDREDDGWVLRRNLEQSRGIPEPTHRVVMGAAFTLVTNMAFDELVKAGEYVDCAFRSFLSCVNDGWEDGTIEDMRKVFFAGAHVGGTGVLMSVARDDRTSMSYVKSIIEEIGRLLGKGLGLVQ